MFIKSISLSNFKGFIGDDHQINFRIPNGQEGSGLNIFVGENNSGKSIVFEAIDFLRNGFKEDSLNIIKSKLQDKTQPQDACVEMTFCGDISQVISSFVQDNKQDVFLKLITQTGSLESLRARRKTSSVKKLELWNDSQKEFNNPSGIDAPFKTLFETNFIWADTNPNDQATFGATTLCGLLLKEIAQAHITSNEYKDFQDKFNKVFNDSTSSLRKEISVIEEKVQHIFLEQFGQANIYFKFDELKIDSFFKNASIYIDDGIDVPMSEKGNGMQRSVALALLQVYAEQLASKSENQMKPFYLFLDEPEICLHPQGQTKLLKSLLEISKNRQVFLTTHSPYFLSIPELKNTGLFIFKKKDGIKNIVEDISINQGLLPWSPTWGEINFKAYNLPTVEFHNELYGILQEKSQCFNEENFEKWLGSKNINCVKEWTREKNGKPQHLKLVTLQTFIRNCIHHPENQTMRNSKYTDDELRCSIEGMINLLKSLP